MSNPWLKKNPFMSMWLSAANRAAGTFRGQANAAVKQAGNEALKTGLSAAVATPKVRAAKTSRAAGKTATRKKR